MCRPCGEVVPLPVGFSAAVAPFAPPMGGEASVGAYRPTDLGWAESPDGPGATLAIHTPARAPAFGLAFFALFWDGFLVFWYSLALGGNKKAPLVMILFPLLHVGAGVFITYAAICGIFNRITIRVDPARFVFRAGPIPVRGNVDEPTSIVAGFEATKIRSSRRGRTRGTSWGVHMLTRDGRSVPLRFGFSESSHAQYAAARLLQMVTEARQSGVTYRDPLGA